MTAMASLRLLRQEFASRGWDRKQTPRVLLELAFGLALALASIGVFLVSHNFGVRIVAIFVATLGSLIVATNTHTSSHYATSDRRWLNELLTFLGYPLFLGLSATYWWHKHVVVHHPTPNVVGVDEDADLLPFFAVTRDEIEASRGFRRFYHEHIQWWLLPVAVAGAGFNMQRAGWGHLISVLFDKQRRKGLHWADLFFMVLHYGVWIGLPLLWFPWTLVVGLYVLRTVLMGYGLYAVLAPGHLPAEAVAVAESQKGADRVLLLTATTVNFRTGFVGRMLCSGLEYQVEHHLFPHISHVHYREMGPVVEQFCRDNGLPYRSYGWAQVLWKSWMVLRIPKAVEHDLNAQRLNEPALRA